MGAGVRARAALGRLAREPLTHFLLIGLVIFLAAQAWRAAHDTRRIEVTPERAAELATKYRMQFGTAPNPAQMEALVAAYVQEEALYREGQAMGLDQDDEIVRRRIAQKVTFLQQDRALPGEPDAAALRTWFQAHAADYATPVRTTYSHLYFSADQVGEAAARARAAQALQTLQAGGSPQQAETDPFSDLNAYANQSRAEATRLFGDTELARRLDTAPLGQWSGPYRSGYGWHLVRAEARVPASAPPLEAVREHVREDYLHAAQAAANAQVLARLQARYTVVRRDREAEP